MPEQTLPSFKSPPLIEVVSGVVFDPLAELNGTAVGQYWHSQRKAFPKRPTELEPIGSLFELFELPGGRVPPAGSVLVNEALPGSRYLLENAEGTQVVQVQRDRFLCNWRRHAPSNEYPRFDALYSFFQTQTAAFELFLAEELSAQLTPRHYELVYVNHIPLNAAAELGLLLPDASWRTTPRWLVPPEAVETSFTFAMPDKAGRLRVRAQTAEILQTKERVVVLELTARGFLDDRDRWFKLAHEWIVRGFDDLLSPSLATTLGRN
ncbi:MAG: TIGR04255 family protein [Myxococcus sp.]|nr:TIGR04255 family protein [Myxococcus sp.]